MRQQAGRVRAPELPDGSTLAGLRGRWVLLDFWTAGCVNCIHVAEQLRPLEQRWSGRLVVVGVHSAKFPHEAHPRAVADAVARLGVRHTVVNDPDLRAWSAYNIKAWPTLVLVDPAGYIAASLAGEGHVGEIEEILGAAMTPPVVASGPRSAPAASLVRYPAGAMSTPSGTVLVCDAGQHQVVEFAADLHTEIRRWGGGRGEPFVLPSGLARMPAGLGYGVLLADAGGHRLHGLSLTDGSSRPVAGTGEQWWPGDPSDGPAATTGLSTPTDVQWWPALGVAVVAMAGNHTLSAFDPTSGTLRRFAGTGVEGLLDGVALQAFLAQPSGLAVDGDRLWFVDAESSALRHVEGGRVHTSIGAGLFDFGHVDGPAEVARLQHPMGLTVLADHTVLIADTYNGAVRHYDPRSGLLNTVARDLAEPYAVLAVADRVLCVESAEHRIVDLPWSPASNSTPGGRTET